MVNVILVLLICMPFVHGANILAILPTPSYSHQIAYSHIWKELSLRGHKVTALTTNPLKGQKLTNLIEIDLSWTYEFVRDYVSKAQQEYTMWNMHSKFLDFTTDVAAQQLSYPAVQNLIHNRTQFDIVFVELWFPEYFAFAEIYNCPKIAFCTVDAPAIFHHSFGNPTNPVLYPDMGSIFYGPLSFKERVISTLYTWYTLYFYANKVFVDKNQIVKKFFNISRPLSEIVNDIDMLFMNTNPILQPIRAIGPSTITIGDERSSVTTKPLSEDIQEFLDSARDGFIYFSLGSNVKSKDLKKESFEAVVEALREIPYKVLWKFEADKFPNKPENVKLIKWAPQQTVLSHPNIKVFVTQGGLQSIEEAFYRGVPFVVIPFFGDQGQNARMIENKGIGISVDRLPSIDKLQLKNAILEVINNPKYRNTVKKLKHLAKDVPMTGLEKAIWWTEYVIRNKGAKHLRNPAADIPFYQYYLIDVIGFLVSVVIASLLMFYLATRTLYTYVKSLFRKPVSKQKKNN